MTTNESSKTGKTFSIIFNSIKVLMLGWAKQDLWGLEAESKDMRTRPNENWDFLGYQNSYSIE